MAVAAHAQPTVVTLAASGQSNMVATLNGTVNPNGSDTTAWFEWGPTTNSYTNLTVASSVGSGGSAVVVSNALAGLTPGLVYHGRMVGSNSSGISYGGDVAFGSPVLTLLGPTTTNLAVGGTFTDPGAIRSGEAQAIAAGTDHSLALKFDGTVVAWGGNDFEQTNVPVGLGNVMAIAAGGYHSLALKSDGTVVAWGDYSDGQTNVPFGLSGVVAVAGGGGHSLALKSDGTVVAWGKNSQGQTNVPAGLSNVIAVAGGILHSLALQSDGTVVAWGYNHAGQSSVPGGLSNVVAIGAGEDHSLAAKSDGTIVGWGKNNSGESTAPVGLSNVVAVAGGSTHSVALKSDGTVIAWGNNDEGQTNVPVGLGTATAIAVGAGHNLALGSDGAVVAWGRNDYGQTNVPAGLTTQTVSTNGTVDVNTPGTYTITYSVTNSLGGVNVGTRTVTVLGPAPVLSLDAGTLAFTEGDGFTAVAPNATALDVNGDWNGGTLTVQIATNASSVDYLKIGNGLGVSVLSYDVIESGVTFGTLNPVGHGGQVAGSIAMVITFNSNATDARVQQLVRSMIVDVATSAPSTATRTVVFTLVDAAANSTPATRDFSVTGVNTPAVVSQASSFEVTEDVAGAIAALGVYDYDAGLAPISVLLTVSSGTFIIPDDQGFNVGGSGTANVGFEEPYDSVNIFLNFGSLLFLPATNATTNVTLTVTVDDYGNSGTGGSKTTLTNFTIAVSAVNDAPSITDPSSISVTEDVRKALTGISFADADAASGSLTATFAVGTGTLSATSGGGVTVGGSGGTTLTLDGALADLNSFVAASNVTFITATNAYTNVFLSVRINDNGNTGTGGALSATNSVVLTVTPVTDYPSIALNSGSAAFIEAANAPPNPVAVDPGLIVSDPDGPSITAALVAISQQFVAGEDFLNFTNSSVTVDNISGSYDANGGYIQLTSAGATATLAHWQAALRSITYANTSETPGTATRTVTFLIYAGPVVSAPVTRTVTVTATNDPPQLLNLDGDSVTFTENGPAVALDALGDALVTDADFTTFNGGYLLVRIATNLVSAQDVLGLNTNGSVTLSAGMTLNSVVSVGGTNIGTIASAGSAGEDLILHWNTAATTNLVQAVLRALVYTNVNDTPTTSSRAVVVTLEDAAGASATAEIAVAVIATDDVPTVTTSGGAAAFVEGANTASTPVVVDGGLVVADPDDTDFVSATLAITGYVNASEDVLAFENNGVTMGDIEGSYLSGSNVLQLVSLGGSATKAQFQAALRSVTYLNLSDAPSTNTRTISVYVLSGPQISAPATRAVTIAAANDSPQLTNLDGDVVLFTEAGPSVALDAGGDALVIDPDAEPFALGMLEFGITNNVSTDDTLFLDLSGAVQLPYGLTNEAPVAVSGITIGWFTTTGTNGMHLIIGLNSNATPALVQTLVRAVSFTNSSAAPSTATREIFARLYDSANVSASVGLSVDITTVDTAPGVATSSGVSSYVENMEPMVIDAGVTVDDVDSATLDRGSVIIWQEFHRGEDVLSFTNDNTTMGNISGTYSGVSGILNLDSADNSATHAQWQAALRSVRYFNASETPSTNQRTLRFRVNDGTTWTHADRALSVTSTNDTPTFTVAWSRTFTRRQAMSLSGVGPGSTSPQSLTVSGLTSPPQKVTATIARLSHSDEVALGILLTSPAGTNVSLLGDNGNHSALDDVTLIFDDEGTELNEERFGGGRYRPSIFPSDDTFTGGPARPYGETLSVFNGADANGDWQLFMEGDLSGNSGVLDYGWSLTFTMGAATNSLWTPEDQPLVFADAHWGLVCADPDTATSAGALEISVTNGTLTLGTATGLSGVGSGTSSLSYTGMLVVLNTALDGMVFTPDAGFSGEATVSFTLHDQGANGGGPSLSVTTNAVIQVIHLNQPPSFDLTIGYGQTNSSAVLGWDQFGVPTNPPPTLGDVAAISAGWQHALALRTDGTVAAWGLNDDGQTDVPAGLTNVVAISAGGNHSLALLGDGTVVAWGRNDWGECNVPADLTNAVAIAAGSQDSLAVREDGTIAVWGLGTAPPSGLTGVRDVVYGANHAVVLFADGTVGTYGADFLGQLNQPPGLAGVRAIAAGYYHSIVLHSNGTVSAWGNNGNEQSSPPAHLTNIVTIGASAFGGFAVRDDGSLVSWGTGFLHVNTPSLSRVLEVDGGVDFALARVPHILQPISVAEDSGPFTLVGAATNIVAGPAGESSQSVTFHVLTAEPNLFSVQPAIDATGTLTFTPAPNAYGLTAVSVEAVDDGGTANGGIDSSAAQTFAIEIVSVEDEPLATHDAFSVAEGGTLSVAGASGVLTNDVDGDGEPLGAVLVTDVSTGVLVFGSDGAFVYLPPPNFFGTDSFQYRATNSSGTSAVATVTLTVTPVNDPPEAYANAIGGYPGSVQGLFQVAVLDLDAGTNLVSVEVSSPVAALTAIQYGPVTVLTNALEPRLVRVIGSVSNLANYLGAGGVALHAPDDVMTNFTYTVTVDDHGHTGADPGLSGTATNEIASATAPFWLSPITRRVVPPGPGTYRAGDTLDFTVQASRPLLVNTNNGTPDITLTLFSGSRTASYLSGSGTTNLLFRYVVQSGDWGTNLSVQSPIEFNAATITDLESNGYSGSFTAPAMDGVIVDALQPGLLGLFPIAPAWYPLGAVMSFTVLFTEDMIVDTNGGVPRLALTLENTNAHATYVAGSGGNLLTFQYTVREGDLATNGLVVSSNIVLNGGTLCDVAGNDAALDFGGDLALTGVRVDGVPPTFDYAIHFTPTLAFNIGSEIHFVAYVSEPVTVDTNFGPIQIEYQFDFGPAYGNYVSNETSGDRLHFVHTVQPGDQATNGFGWSTNLFFNSLAIMDVAGNPARPALPWPYRYENIVVDSLVPAITNATLPPDGIYTSSEPMDFVFEYTEAVTNLGTPRFTLTVNGATRYLSYHSGSGSNALVFRYTPQPGDFDTDGISLVGTLDLNGGAIRDLSGNDAEPVDVGEMHFAGLRVDASRPVAGDDDYSLLEDGGTHGFHVLFNDSDADTNTLTLTIVSGATNGTVSPGPDDTFLYTPDANFVGIDGFTYVVSDGLLTSAVATVTVEVLAVNDPPTITGPARITVTNGVARPLLGVAVDDVDAGTNRVQLTLVVDSADSLLLVTNYSGVTVVQSLPSIFSHLHGTVADLNAYFAGTNVFFVASTNSETHPPLMVSVHDEGHDGSDPGIDSDPDGEMALIHIVVDNGDLNEPPVVVAGITNQSGIYGTAFSHVFPTNAFIDPDGDALSYTASGLPPGITFASATRTFAGTPTAAGSYAVRVIGGDGRSPELRATNAFAFVVAKAPLTIAADDQSRACGAPNPAFTLRFEGFRGADARTVLDTLPVARTDANAVSGPGVYSITLTGGSDNNYEFTLVGGTLVITNGALGSGTVRGTYHGLFYETNEVRHESSGAFLIKATAAGAYSGTLELAGAKLRLSGTFPVGRAVTNVIPRRNLSSITVTLGFDDCDPPQAIFGTVSDGSWTAQLMATPLHFHAKTNPAPAAGRYVMTIPGFENDAALPGGDGWGTITVGTAGQLKLAGALADGTKLTEGSFLNEAGLWPFYLPYARSGGAMLGWLTFDSGSETNIGGALAWIRKTQPTTAKFYRAGFTNQTEAVGSRYTDPGRGTNVFPWATGSMIAGGGNLSGTLSNQFNLGLANRVTWLGTNFTALTFTPKDGRFKGTLRHNGTGKPATFNGVIHPALGIGAGYFLGTNQSGAVTLAEP